MTLRKALRRFAMAVAACSAIAFIASFPVEGSYASRAKLTQRIQPDAIGAALFDDVGAGTPIGSPQRMIIDDPKAFLPGTGEQGARLVDESYLTEHRIYPLQMQTVEFFAKYTRIGSAIALLVAGVALMLTRTRASK